jgi:hypothetical protein
MPGRKPDMSAAQAAAMRTVLAEIEAASLLTSNRDTVVQDITNPGPAGVGGGRLTQLGLQRVDRKHQASVDKMVREVCSRLLGNKASEPPTTEEALVWAEAASFLGSRVQDPSADSDECSGRKPDMSMLAAQTLRTMLAKMEVALKLMSNQDRVVQDITNPGAVNIDGKKLTQIHLKRVDIKHRASVNEMVTAVRSRLLGKGVSGLIHSEEALVWAEAATFLAGRVQGPGDCPGRKADMSTNAAEMLCRALGEVEAACKLTSNREKIVQDITNPGLSAVGGRGAITQTDLKRVSYVHRASVDAMMSELCNRLLGRKTNGPTNPGEAQVWAEAAVFFHNRIQVSTGECPGRNPDMSQHAAKAVRKVLPQIANQLERINASDQEAAQMLMHNRERVIQDITNPGPTNIDGKKLTQTDLKRVDGKHRASVGVMVNEVCCCLLGRTASKRPSPEDALVWAEAAAFLAGRIQGTPSDCPGRDPDMSSAAAAALRSMLGQMEAAHMLMNNRERVVQDIANPGPKNIDGKTLTQTDLKRVDAKHRASVDAMVREVCCRLLGKGASMPQAPGEMLVWAKAAGFLSGRIQGTPSDCPGRNPDMSSAAAAALRAVLEAVEAGK